LKCRALRLNKNQFDGHDRLTVVIRKRVAYQPDTPAVRVFSIDEDYETNPHAVCSGRRLRPRDEAVALVERKIAGGSYRAWRYEIRPEMSESENALAPVSAVPTQLAIDSFSTLARNQGRDGLFNG